MTLGNVTKDDLVKEYGEKEIDEMAKGYKVVNFLIEKAKRTDVTLSVTGETRAGGESADKETKADGSSGAN